jgi:hypothetical protein
MGITGYGAQSRGEPDGSAGRAPSREGYGEAEREGASVASGCGGEGAGPEVPEGGSERGGGGGWGAEGRSEPFEGSHIKGPGQSRPNRDTWIRLVSQNTHFWFGNPAIA